MSARRWPVITFALIAINLGAFLLTHDALEQQQRELGRLKLHLVLLAATHPELKVPSGVEDVIDAVKDHYPKEWEQLQTTHRRALDDWDANMLQNGDKEALQTELNSLSSELERVREGSIAEKYAFVPAHPSAISYFTANFLHGGWLHLLGNMWFLWLAGFVLEDFWGRLLYLTLYLLSGVAALAFNAWLNPGSIVPTLGASGAVAALMGAFLVRFPRMRIEMLWWIFARVRFQAPAYWLLPAWLVMEIFYGSILGQSTGVAHWAHVGGFVFGAFAALALRYSGLEHKANRKIEAKLTFESEPEIQQANQLIDGGELGQARTILRNFLKRKSDSVDALNLLCQIHRHQPAECAPLLATLCAVHLKTGEMELAWTSYEEFLKAGGASLPCATWLELCRGLEKEECFERALTEYEKLASTYPAERQSILAQLSAGRLCLKRLNRPERALALFEAAQRSTVPHLDWEQSILAGIREAKMARPQASAAAATIAGSSNLVLSTPASAAPSSTQPVTSER
ncbi:MAG: rhomboid family intramembrane serine protease [Acidobacteria bacterium]|nr:rhomboid family intramembrane serine protease [Acidobacteriota bacterium]